MKKIFWLIGIMFFLASCSEPEIVLHGPSEGQTFDTEAIIPIKATATDPDGLKRVTIKIENHIHDFWPDGASTYELDQGESMTSHPTGHVVEITVEAEDMSGNLGSKKVSVKHS